MSYKDSPVLAEVFAIGQQTGSALSLHCGENDVCAGFLATEDHGWPLCYHHWLQCRPAQPDQEVPHTVSR